MTLSLLMLVRDEASQVEACIATVKPLISTWTVVDTGSEDDTIAKVRAALDGIPGQLHQRPWHGFAHNRTELLQLAQGTADHHLMLDADHRLQHNGPMPELTHDEYMVPIDSGGLEWRLPLIIRDGVNAEYRGAAHSYLHPNQPVSVGTLDAFTVTSARGSSPRDDKISGDAAPLEAQIDPRTIYYLAQTYKDLGHTREAADLLRFRIRLSAQNPEEVFWACYQEGALRLQLDGVQAATGILLEAWQRRPTRAEPLWLLARAYRLAGNNHAALLFANQAVNLPRPADNGFVLAHVYKWGARQERALAAHNLGDHQRALLDFTHIASLGIEGEPDLFARRMIAELEPLVGLRAAA